MCALLFEILRELRAFTQKRPQFINRLTYYFGN